MIISLLCRLLWLLLNRRESAFYQEEDGQWHFCFLGTVHSQACQTQAAARLRLNEVNQPCDLKLFYLEVLKLRSDIRRSRIRKSKPAVPLNKVAVTIASFHPSEQWYVSSGITTRNRLRFSEGVMTDVEYSRTGAQIMITGFLIDYVQEKRWFASHRKPLVSLPHTMVTGKEIEFDPARRYFHVKDEAMQMVRHSTAALLLPNHRIVMGWKKRDAE